MNMSINSSFFAEISPPPPPHLVFNSSNHTVTDSCYRFRLSFYFFCTLLITNLLLLPLSIFILYLGYQHLWKEHCTSSTGRSHSDVFTFHSIAMQLNTLLGFICYFSGGFLGLSDWMLVGLCIWSLASVGQALFHVLTCVERYLAVVHPVTYLGLRHARGVRIRNISIGCVWLLSFGWMAALYPTSSRLNLILYVCVMSLCLSVVCFCSISVLCALKRPKPGELGGNKERVDRSKQRAFHTIVAIMGVLLLKFGGNLTWSLIFSSTVQSTSDLCLGMLSAFFFDLPSSLVLPLMFLHRAGKLPCNTESR